jgi:hypothetical protein
MKNAGFNHSTGIIGCLTIVFCFFAKKKSARFVPQKRMFFRAVVS